MAHEFIYTCYKLARHHPPDRTVLENISLSFYPGAKIGVIGVERRRQVEPAQDHGRARRRLQRRGAADTRLHGRLPRPGAAARSEQGRQGQRDGRRRRGAVDHRSLQRGHGDVGRPRRRLRQDREAAGRARGQDRRRRRLEPRPQRRDRDGRAALPARRRRRHDAVRRREAPRRAVPAAALAARPAAARRAHQPPRCRVGADWLERFLQEYQGTVVAITHDRYFLDNVAQWILELDRGRGIPFEGNYTVVAGAEGGPARARGEGRTRPAGARCSASSNGCAWRRRRARRRARRASRRTRSCRPRPSRRPTSTAVWRSRSRPGRASATP